jgi:hypothetical protein
MFIVCCSTVPGIPPVLDHLVIMYRRGRDSMHLHFIINICFSFTPAMQVHQNDLVVMKSATEKIRGQDCAEGES